MKLHLAIFSLALIIALLQTSLLPSLGIYLDALLVFVLTVSYATTREFGALTAFASGLLLDLMSVGRFGVFTFTYTLFANIFYLLLNLFGKKFFNLTFLVIIFSTVEQLILKSPPSFVNIISNSIVSVGIALLFYPCIKKLREKLWS